MQVRISNQKIENTVTNIIAKELTVDQFYEYCKLKLKEFIYKCELDYNMINLIPLYLFDNLDRKSVRTILANWVYYQYGRNSNIDTDELVRLINGLYDIDPRHI